MASATPSQLDCQRAILCCACSYRNLECSKQELAAYAHSVQLTILQYGERSLYRMVLAIAPADDDHKRTLFVALPGSQTCRDWLVNLDIRHMHLHGLGIFQGAVEGQYHSGFVSRLQEILPDMPRLSEYMSKESIDRLVFCGHSLGGALAHMALIRFIMQNGLDVPRCQHISIAFGSPDFCDSAAASYLDTQLGLRERMFTYVRQDDPVPRLLKDFERARSAAIWFLLKRVCERMKPINWWPRKIVDSGNPQEVPTPQGANLPPAFSHQDFGLSWVAILSVLQCCGKAPRYAQAGRFFHLPEESADQRLQQEPIPLDEDLQPGAVETINSESIQKHATGAYLRVCNVRASPSTDRVDVRPESICPHISSAKFKFKGKLHEELKEAHILIEGKDLFLPWRCRVQGLNRTSRGLMEGVGWDIHSCEQADSRIVLELRQKVSLAMISSFTKCECRVSITTCFGESNECTVTVQRPSFDSLIQLNASRAISRLLLLKACGCSDQERLHECQSLLTDALRKRKWPGTEQKEGFSRALEDMRPQELHAMLCRTREEFVEPLVTELNTLYDIPRARWLPAIFIEWLSACTKEFPYNKQLAYLVQCCTDDAERKPRERRPQASFFYEEELYKQLREKPELLREEKIRARMVTDYPEELITILLEKAEMLRCIWKANELLEGDANELLLEGDANKLLEGVKVVMFVGPEFAGKSELIKCLMEGGQRWSMEQGSVQCCWMEDERAVLVEVPGNVRRRGRFERWPDLEHVADLCVVVVSYAGNTREAAKEWAAEARQLSACRDGLLLVVNGVDRVLHGSGNALVWKTATKVVVRSDRDALAGAADLRPECVFMAVARPPNELEPSTVPKLKDRGILLREEITEILRSRIASIHTAHTYCRPFSYSACTPSVVQREMFNE